MASASSKHLMEGELSVQILLYDVQPFRLSRLSFQLLQQGEQTHWHERTEPRALREGHSLVASRAWTPSDADTLSGTGQPGLPVRLRGLTSPALHPADAPGAENAPSGHITTC